MWGQVIVTATQLMVHYANDYYDLAADRSNDTATMWSGGSRVLVDGHLSPRIAQITAIGCGLVALIGSSLLVVATHNLVLFLLLFTAIVLAWFYSAPPGRLHSRGVGELSATVIVDFLTPLTGYYLQAGRLTLLPLLAAIAIGLLQFNMLISVALPDMEGDILAKKRTLVVRLGRTTTRRIYLILLALVYGLLPLLVVAGLAPLVSCGHSLTVLLSAPLWLLGLCGARSRPPASGWIT